MTPLEPKNADSGPGSAQDRLAALEAQLETYKKTLTEIYALYDQRIEELSLIRGVGDSIRTPLDLETLCRELVAAVAGEIVVDHLALLLVDQDRENLVLTASFDVASDETRFYHDREARRLDPDQGLPGEALRTGRPVLAAEAPADHDPLGSGAGPSLSLLLLPLVARDKAVGLFSLSRSARQPFGQSDLRILTIISDQAATALANVKLFNELAAANVRLQASEGQARRTSMYLESLLEAANDVIFTLDARGRITYVNRKIQEWGYTKEALIGRPLDDLAADGPPAALIEKKIVQGLEAGFSTRDGGRRDVLLSTSRIEDESGQGAAWLVLARDITERKQLERQLFHSEKLASIGILASGVAHEVGNPLSAISGYAQILQSGGVDAVEAREYLDGIESQAARIQRIIEDLLSYSRPSTGHRSEIELSEALPQIMSMLTAQRVFRGIEAAYDLAPDLPPVIMDRDHLAQVIINIALNAAQAMPDGGALRIRAERENDRVLILLSDTGPGIPAELRDRVFDPFFTTKPVGRGTGLGLAICHRIVESYGGSIELAAGPGPGATFVVGLPAASGERTADA
ncbi:MAG: GAF domain-containing protein [Proteobacteria bacterium]|nr:GAF domain-containing protein [Pseudomonadota bacterium]